jgi:type IV secretion system protein VirB6
MFNWVGSKFDGVLSTYVLGVVTALMAAIAPVALTAMTIWVLLYGWAVLRNEVSETLPTFMWKVFKIGLVLAFALQSGFYISNVSDTANALAMGVATTFLPTGVRPATITTPYAMLDKFNDDASQLVARHHEGGRHVAARPGPGSGGLLDRLCRVPLHRAVRVTLAKLFLTFVIAIGPLFICALAWRPRRGSSTAGCRWCSMPSC